MVGRSASQKQFGLLPHCLSSDEIVELERISYHAEFGQAITRVVVEFFEQGNQTRVVLTHDGFPNESFRKTVSQGTTESLDKLAAVLARTTDSPVVALNHAVAVAMSRGFATGLKLIEQIAAPGDLDSYYLYHAARADLLRRLRRKEQALAAYQRALSLSANAVERRYLRRRMAELSNV